MQNDRPSHPGTVVAACVWCDSEYVVGFSRAHEQGIFCSKKCEIEARFWLMEVLRSIEAPPRNPDDNGGRTPRP
jgi:hypothetical protein